MLHRQQLDLTKLKQLLVHPALIVLCAADVVGYYATRARLDAPVSEAAEPAIAGAGARGAPTLPPAADFALPRQPAVVGLVGDLSPEPSATVQGNSPPIDQLAVIEPDGLPAVDRTALSPRPHQRASIAPVIARAIDRTPEPRAPLPGRHSSAERTTARTLAAEFARAFPAHFAASGRAARLGVATPQTGANLTSLAEPGANVEIFAPPVGGDQVEPERRGDMARDTELPRVPNQAQENSSRSTPEPAPPDIGVDAPVEQSGAVVSTADQSGAETAPVAPRLAVTAVAAVYPKAQHAIKRRSAAEPLAVLAGKRANVRAVAAKAATRHDGSLVIPHRTASPRAALTYSRLGDVVSDLAGAGSIHDGHIAVRLGDLLDAFEPVMDRAEFEYLSRSPHTAKLVTLATLRGAGIPVRYNAADRTIAAAFGVRISAASLA